MKIISQETIKPSSPTPPHLRTHVLSLADSVIPGVLMEFVYLYESYKDGGINILKKSLSQCLTQYYPFAGRFLSPPVSAIDCNDEGVEFIEASHDRKLEEFVEKYEMLYDLVPHVSSTSSSLLHVQLNYFKGGGAAISISISHILADGFTASTFVSQWAKIARGEPSFKPTFFQSSTTYHNAKRFEVESRTQDVKHVRRSFVFPNSNINNLKKHVISMGIDQNQNINIDPTRVEVLTSLIFKCMVDSATTKYGGFRPSILLYPVNMRKKIFDNDPERAVGNIISLLIERMDDLNTIALNQIVSKLIKGKMVEEKDVPGVGERLSKTYQNLGGLAGGRMYWSSSFCWFPLYEVDFGWGKPVKVRFVVPDTEDAYFTLLDTPNKDGIEVIVKLPEEEMMILQQNKELLAYVDS